MEDMVETEESDGERNKPPRGPLPDAVSSVQDVRQKLEVWFEGILAAKDPRDLRLAQVVATLEKCPNLARDHCFGQGMHRGSPLSVLIYARAPLRFVRPVYKLFPEAISQRQSLQFLPLHVACERQAPEEVVEFLARESPDALLANDQAGHLPIHYAMKHPSYARFQTIELLMELCPQSVGYKNKFGYDILEYSLHNNYPRDMIEKIMRRYPHNKREFSLSYSATVLDGPLSQAITTHLLPQLTQFKCEPTQWTSGGFVHLLHCLSAARDLAKVRLRLPRELLLWNAEARDGLQEFLKNTTILDLQLILMASGARERSFSLNEKQQSAYNDLLAAVGAGLQANTTLPSVTLINFCFHTVTAIQDVVPEGFRPRALNLLHGLSLAAEFERCDDDVSRTMESTKLARVNFSGCCVTMDCLEALLQQLPFMTLQTLRLCGIPDRLTGNMTEILVQLLQQDNLTKLAVEGFMECLDTRELLESLKSNTTLQQFHVESSLETEEQRKHLCSILEGYNSTLVDVALPKALPASNDHESPSTFSTIAYYLRLNQYGRRHARNCDTSSTTDMVGLLATAHKASDDTILQFGLLREQPTLWCVADT